MKIFQASRGEPSKTEGKNVARMRKVDMAAENAFYARAFQFSPPLRVGGLEFLPRMFHLVNSDKNVSGTLLTHDTFEFSLIEAGRILYVTEDEKILLGEGDVFAMPPGVPHTWKGIETPLLISGYQISLSALNENEEVLNGFFDELTLRRYHLRNFHPFQKAMRGIRGEFLKAERLASEKIWAITWNLLVELSRATSMMHDDSTSKTENVTAKVKMMRNFITLNIGVPLVLADVAHYVNLSTRHAARIFKQEEGIPLGEYILNAKIDEAKRLLAKTDASVKTVALDLGFEINYFCRLFKNKTGRTPSEHRSQQTGVL
jgi:AraC-like DNA-binding protein/mannose-6-phosphate isomerase-like protein (cupin superfamily)